MRILRAEERVAAPWKNGGGVTREVCADAHAAAFQFHWRLSIAEVRSGGPFSCFPGVDRKLAVLAGRMRLIVDCQQRVELTPDSPTASFPGELATSAEVVEPVIDVNLMTRRNFYRGDLRRRHLKSRESLPKVEAETIVLAIDPLRTSAGELGALDAIWLEAGVSIVVEPKTTCGSVIVARIWPILTPETD